MVGPGVGTLCLSLFMLGLLATLLLYQRIFGTEQIMGD